MPLANASAKPKILVVEDSYLTAAAVCDMVVRYGCDVAGTVGRVETGVKFVRENPVDGAVVDIDLHGIASFPICEQLKQRDIPFVFLTGCERPYRVPEQFRNAPWLHKPVDDREFEVALAGLARTVAPEAGRGNLILDRLSDADWTALQPLTQRISLGVGEVLNAPGSETAFLHFPVTSVVSIAARSSRGKAVEVALVGREGVIGLELMLGQKRSPGIESIVHFSGTALRVPADEMRALLAARPTLRAELLTAVHAFIGQLADSAASLGNGTIEQRLARRLLMASLRLGSRRLVLTHDQLARLLAVRRSGITVALHMLESRRVILSRRNLVEILDYEGLLRASEGADVSYTEAGSLQ
jgi:CRP-like cAMP-binding protein